MNERLKARRVELGFKQADLASAIGVSQAAISAFERGSILPSLEVLCQLERTLESPARSLGYTRVVGTSVARLEEVSPCGV